ncbi:transposase (plasmid) [Cereibacter azotoformans]|uniref:IS66-like element accessory protein TnpA n=1 Tax=Cereibacter azotoformans TaxID=43057 RepID=UPI001EECA0CB|nr:transposase [Cereibacter azotoformans]ULB12048.1 transposase [Cereibacter azotoformans]
MSCAKVVSQFEVFAAGELGRRRTWSDAEKIRIVEESYRGHRQGSVVARRHGISRALLTQWRRAYDLGQLDGAPTAFTALEIAPDPMPLPQGAPRGADTDARVEITLANGRRLAVRVDIEASALTRLVQVLERA